MVKRGRLRQPFNSVSIATGNFNGRVLCHSAINVGINLGNAIGGNSIQCIIGRNFTLSSACDVLIQRAGVCRDFAHLSIAFCRAIGIPARYVAGYAPELQPPDFHGFFEAYLGGKWYLFDATKLAPVSGFVRIGTGRDAADASFATLVGQATMDSMVVSAVTASGESLIDTGIAVSSATQ